MKSPFTGKEMSVVKERRSMSFRKEDFEVVFHNYQCVDTGEMFEDELFAELNYNQAVNQYRVKYSIPFPDEIKAIRNQYKLPATKMSEILGFGVNSYRQYEAGEVPSIANAKLILLSAMPREFKKLVVMATTLDEETKNKIIALADSLILHEKKELIKTEVLKYIHENELASVLTGYKQPVFNKLAEMVIYFSQELKPWKTKLNKLLFYSDFLHFKLYGQSISGTKYIAITMGPVPNQFNGIFDYLRKEDYIKIDYTDFENGIGEQFRCHENKVFNRNIFSEKEMQVIETVCEKFKNTSTNDIINISHQESAWLENISNSQAIDYNYAFDLVHV